MSASFKPIGPYALTRWDLLVAELVILWRVPKGWRRALSLFSLIFWLVLAVFGVIISEPILSVIGICLLLFRLISPLLRWRSKYREVYLSPNPEGLRSDVNDTAGVFKWSVVGQPFLVGSRCYIPVKSAMALVFPVSATSKTNLSVLFAYVAENRGCD